MKANLISWLLSTGLDEQRANIYLSALSQGEATAKELARTLKMNRTAVYDNLRVLEERGYIKTIHAGKRKIFVPLHPKELHKKFVSQKKQLEDLLPDFLSLYAEKAQQPFVQLFTGKFAAREVYEDIINTTKKEYVYLSPPDLTWHVVDHNYMKKWIERRVQKGLQAKSLWVKSKTQTIQAIPYLTEEQKYLRQIKYLPTYVDLKAAIYIYENNIGVIATVYEGSAFIINSPDLAYSMRKIFDFLWSISTKG
jgi:sugar-specific transcriptional regulator TrmB